MRKGRNGNINARSIAIMASCVLVLAGASLPKSGPVPVPRPAAKDTSQAEAPAQPVPEATRPPTPKPAPPSQPLKAEETNAGKANADSPGVDEPGVKDTDAMNSEAKDTEDAGADGGGTEAEKKAPPPPLVREDDATFAACIGALRAGGAIVDEAAPIDPKNGCGITRPIVLKRLSTDVKISPEATLRCETALQLQRWIKGSVAPAIEATTPEKKLTGLEQASAYVCRNRNNAKNGKVSEHAYGNAVDIAAFSFSDGSRLDIAPRGKDSTVEGALQRAAVATACLYFRTVLDPGSDAAHETHLHLDVLQRRNGYRYCW